MSNLIRSLASRIILGIATVAILSPCQSIAASGAEIDYNADLALQNLYANNTTARLLAKEAKAILVFPSIVKAGFIIGVQGGNGALRKDGRTIAYYNTASASYGLQAGIQKFGYALFFMSDSALDYLYKS